MARRSSPHDLEVKMWGTENTPEPHPDRENHFHSPGPGDVTQVDRILPSKRTENPGDGGLGFHVVATDEEIAIAFRQRGIDHYLAVGRVQRLYNKGAGKKLLNFLAERVRIGELRDQRWRHAMGRVQRIRNIDD